MSTGVQADLEELFLDYFRNYEREAIYSLAERYPREQAALEIDHADLYTFDPNLSEDWLHNNPETIRDAAERALAEFDLPIPTDLSAADVRLVGLPDDAVYYPGEFSPTDRSGEYVGIRGEVSKASDVYSRIVEATFECQRCGARNPIPQAGGRDFQEPHECRGCERDGPFEIDFDASEFVDAQMVRLSEPPEIAAGGGQTIDAYLEGDLTDRVSVGDRATIDGVLHLEQQSSASKKTGKFTAWLDGVAIEIESSDHTELDITSEERARIQAIAAGEEGDPLDVAAHSLAPKLLGADHIKRMAILQLVGGERVVYPDGSADRGDIHMLLLGDPSTAKSKLLSRVESTAPLGAVGVSGKGATEAGITASATQDDFGDGEWTLEAGAFVKANNGVVCIDELDDMPTDVRAAMLEPMSQQTIHVTKAGINARLQTRAAVIAAGNPKYGRWDAYKSINEQFDIESNLLSRFDLIYTLQDQPDEQRDREIASHITRSREAAKRLEAGEEIDEQLRETVEPPIEPELLAKWLALAKQFPEDGQVTFANDELREQLDASFTRLRGANGYDEDDPVPVAWRKLEALQRLAEAAAKLEFSRNIEERHVEIATEAVGRSMRDFGRNEEGRLDADVTETGESMPRRQREQLLEDLIQELQDEEEHEDGVPRDVLAERAAEEADLAAGKVEHELERMSKEKGWIYEPKPGETVKWLGRT